MIEQLAELDFYQNLYETEINRKNEINGLVKFPTTLLSILIGAGFYLYKPLYENFDCSYLSLIIVFCSILFSFSISIAVFF